MTDTNDNTTRFTVRNLPDHVVDTIRTIRESSGVSNGEVITAAVNALLKQTVHQNLTTR